MPSIRREVRLIIYAAFFAFLSAFYFWGYPIVGSFWLRLAQVGLPALLVLLLAGVGRRLLRWFPGAAGAQWPGTNLSLESFLFSFGIGALPFVLLLFLAGVMGFYTKAGLGILSGVLALAGVRDALSWAGWAGYSLLRIRLAPAFRAAVAILLWLAVLLALAPPNYYDSLVYHLALPAKYLQEGRMGFVPYNQYAHFPQNMELLFGWFLAVGWDVSAQVFNVALAGLSGLAIWLLGTGRRGQVQSQWPLLLYLTAPCVLLLCTETYVEVPMAFWTCLAVLAAARAMEKNRRVWFVLSGLLGGFAAGIKYTGVITPVLLAGLVLLWPRRRPFLGRLADAAAVGGASLLIFLPWMVKNYYLTGGNPVFPFLPGIFPAKAVYMYKEASDAYFQVLSEYKGSSALLTEIFMMPFRLVGNTASFGGGFDVMGDYGWVLPLLLLPLAFFCRKPEGSYRFIAAYLFLHIALWASLRPVLRFLYPVFPLACWVAGEGLAGALAGFGRWARALAGVVAALYSLSGAVLVYAVESVRQPLLEPMGLLTREQYLSKKLDYYPAMAFMEGLPQQSRVLFFGDQRGYYCPRPYVAPMALLPQPLHAWADAAADAADLRRRLLAEGYTHLFFNRREAERLASYRIMDFTPRGAKIFSDLLRELPVVHDAQFWVIYRVSP